MTVEHLSKTTFASLNLPTSLQQGIDDLGYTHCTPIQADTLPKLLQGEDILGQGQTGTGKTAAFLVAAIARILTTPASESRQANQPRVFILAPTRELASQIYSDAEKLAKHTELKVGVVFGGVNYRKQAEMVRNGLDILIGTPGRLIDYYKQKHYNLKAVEVLILDEADRMFDLGFIKDIRYLLRRLPEPTKRLNMLFSATLSYRVNELAYEHMNAPKQVTVEAEKITADKVAESVYCPANEEKIPLLLQLLGEAADSSRSIVFVNTKNTADLVCRYLKGNDIKASLLSGDVPQKKRMQMLTRFEDKEFDVLVATDVAARGLHIPAVTHVYNYDLPEDCKDYVHRIGRTARAGASGEAISFACESYAMYLPDIEAYLGYHIDVASIDNSKLVAAKPPVAKQERKQRPHGKHAKRNKSRRPRSNRDQSRRN